MEFTRNEKLAIVCALVHMMNVDSNVDISEGLYFLQIQVRFSISEEEFQTGKEWNLLSSLSIIRDMNRAKKTQVVALLIGMVEADGKVDPRELKLFKIISDACGFEQLTQ